MQQMAQDSNILDNFEIIDLNLFDGPIQFEQILDDVSFFETNSSFNFLNATNSFHNPVFVNYNSYESPIQYTFEEYGSLPVSDLDSNQVEETTSEEESKPDCSSPAEQSKNRRRMANFDKPPEPYADMIAKAILTSEDNLMQLKDIYTYMTKNYEDFTSKVETSKWKSAIRHNLSSHSFFIKTSFKNAQGHFWSIETSYLPLIKEKGTTVGIKKCLNRKPRVQKPRAKKQKIDSTEHQSETVLAGSTSMVIPQNQELYDAYYTSPIAYNDSAFFSSNENDSSSVSSSSSSSNSSYIYKFLMNSSPQVETYQPYGYYTIDNTNNVNYVNLINQQELSY
ncbi:unnamed protein product [Brachionus calyciflorus]|uniref:Fork-head domain-containing protein n=1 Tax=Brachionus calyciflorus TaxID=104777 RepID=A0A813VS93_9BILA|nr:unnamed protein product [Brachionus calyciflorus]